MISRNSYATSHLRPVRHRSIFSPTFRQLVHKHKVTVKRNAEHATFAAFRFGRLFARALTTCSLLAHARGTGCCKYAKNVEKKGESSRCYVCLRRFLGKEGKKRALESEPPWEWLHSWIFHFPLLPLSSGTTTTRTL